MRKAIMRMRKLAEGKWMIPGERPEILEIGDWDEVVESRPMTVEPELNSFAPPHN